MPAPSRCGPRHPCKRGRRPAAPASVARRSARCHDPAHPDLRRDHRHCSAPGVLRQGAEQGRRRAGARARTNTDAARHHAVAAVAAATACKSAAAAGLYRQQPGRQSHAAQFAAALCRRQPNRQSHAARPAATHGSRRRHGHARQRAQGAPTPWGPPSSDPDRAFNPRNSAYRPPEGAAPRAAAAAAPHRSASGAELQSADAAGVRSPRPT